MTRTQELDLQSLSKARRVMNLRLAQARREGRLEEEMRLIAREGMRIYRDVMVEACSRRNLDVHVRAK